MHHKTNSKTNMTIVERFLDYVKFDTQSDELTNLTPSTPGQMVFAQYHNPKRTQNTTSYDFA